MPLSGCSLPRTSGPRAFRSIRPPGVQPPSRLSSPGRGVRGARVSRLYPKITDNVDVVLKYLRNRIRDSHRCLVRRIRANVRLLSAAVLFGRPQVRFAGMQWRLRAFSGDCTCAVAIARIQWRLRAFSGDCTCAVAIARVQWRLHVCSGDCAHAAAIARMQRRLHACS